MNGVVPGAISNLEPFDYETDNNFDTIEANTTWGLSAEINWELPFADLTSITSYRDSRTDVKNDADMSGADVINSPGGFDVAVIKTASQELRFQGTNGPLDWMVGAYYYKEEQTNVRSAVAGDDYVDVFTLRFGGAAFVDAVFFGNTLGTLDLDGTGGATALSFGAPSEPTFGLDVESVALFTHNSYAINDTLTATVGLRYSVETKEIDFRQVGGNEACDQLRGLTGAARADFFAASQTARNIMLAVACNGALAAPSTAPFDGERTENVWTGTVNLSYQFENDWLAFVSASKGYKGGGFTLDAAPLTIPGTLAALGVPGFSPLDADDLEYEDEQADTYELGIKTQFRDYVGFPLIVNATAFHTFFRNFQLSNFSGQTFSFTTVNIPRVFSSGVELEVSARPFAGTSLDAGVTYADAKFGDDMGLAGRDDRQLSRAPKWSITGGVTQLFPILPNAGLVGVAHLSGKWTSSQNLSGGRNPFSEQESYALFNATLGVRDADGGWSVELWGKNIFDQEYAYSKADSLFSRGADAIQQVFVGEPATYGVRGRVNF
ncbi:MAG: TonB-dependent receptor [Alphaproteobacteria bacterium]|nr:TonB-dependent receptor [Alphaproteobacteria bacterium]